MKSLMFMKLKWSEYIRSQNLDLVLFKFCSSSLIGRYPQIYYRITRKNLQLKIIVHEISIVSKFQIAFILFS